MDPDIATDLADRPNILWFAVDKPGNWAHYRASLTKPPGTIQQSLRVPEDAAGTWTRPSLEYAGGQALNSR